jgi:hypothetical protein
VEGYGKNTDLGLYLVLKICSGYGWTLQGTGKKGKEAQFTITVPEFPSYFVLLLFSVLALLVATIYRRKRPKISDMM